VIAALLGLAILLSTSGLAAEGAENPGAAAWRRGRVLLEQGLVDAAIAQFTRLVQYDPEDPVAYCYRADAYARKKDWAPVLQDAQRAIKLDPKLAWAYVLRGQAYAGMKQTEKALADFAQAIRLDAEFVPAYVQRGYLYAGLNQPERANRDFRTANRLIIQHATGGQRTQRR